VRFAVETETHLRIDVWVVRHFTAVMRSFVCLLLGVVCLAGCMSPKNDVKPIAGAPAAKNAHEKIVVTQEPTLVGTVARVNESPRFAVLNFPVGTLPGIGQHLNIYRHGLKIGEVRITGPQLDENIIADVTDGGAQVGDTVRGN
jgi:hypothetical protein